MKSQVGIDELLPWHKTCWETVSRARADGRLPHALLVTGPAGLGKRRLVAQLARSLLCSQPDARGLACGRCRDCDLLAADTHPDFTQIGPDPLGKSDEIRVDAIRRLAESNALTAHRGGYKVIVLDPAQNMNPNAANSLLKTLEEPSKDTLLCLICDQPDRLLATIRSRCQEIRVPVPSEPSALNWLHGHTDRVDIEVLLRLANGAPLKALALVDDEQLSQRAQVFAGFADVAGGRRDPIAEAAAWNKLEPSILLSWVSGWISDLLRLASGHRSPRLTNPDKGNELRVLADSLDPVAGHRFLRQILDALEHDQVSLNRLLLYESLLVQWAKVGGSRKHPTKHRG